MSADDRIVVSQRKDGRWVVQYSFASQDFPDPEKGIISYKTLEEAIEMHHDEARETEYGFHIVRQEAPPQSEEPVIDAGTMLERDLAHLLNGYKQTSKSNTPSFILAAYLLGCLRNYENIIQMREPWLRDKT